MTVQSPEKHLHKGDGKKTKENSEIQLKALSTAGGTEREQQYIDKKKSIEEDEHFSMLVSAHLLNNHKKGNHKLKNV